MRRVWDISDAWHQGTAVELKHARRGSGDDVSCTWCGGRNAAANDGRPDGRVVNILIVSQRYKGRARRRSTLTAQRDGPAFCRTTSGRAVIGNGVIVVRTYPASVNRWGACLSRYQRRSGFARLSPRLPYHRARPITAVRLSSDDQCPFGRDVAAPLTRIRERLFFPTRSVRDRRRLAVARMTRPSSESIMHVAVAAIMPLLLSSCCRSTRSGTTHVRCWSALMFSWRCWWAADSCRWVSDFFFFFSNDAPMVRWTSDSLPSTRVLPLERVLKRYNLSPLDCNVCTISKWNEVAVTVIFPKETGKITVIATFDCRRSHWKSTTLKW